MGERALTQRQAEAVEWLVRATLAGGQPTVKAADRALLEAALPKLMRAAGSNVTPKEGRKTIRMLRRYRTKKAASAAGEGR